MLGWQRGRQPGSLRRASHGSEHEPRTVNWFQKLFFIPKPLISGRSIVATVQPTLINMLPQWTVIFLKDLSPSYLKIFVNDFSFLDFPSEEIESALLPLKLLLQKLIIYRNRV